MYAVCPIYSRSSINVPHQRSGSSQAELLSLAGRQWEGRAEVRPKERKLAKGKGRIGMKKDPPGRV